MVVAVGGWVGGCMGAWCVLWCGGGVTGGWVATDQVVSQAPVVGVERAIKSVEKRGERRAVRFFPKSDRERFEQYSGIRRAKDRDEKSETSRRKAAR